MYVEVIDKTRYRLSWQKQGLQQTSTGYGSKLTTEYIVKIKNTQDRWRRVYACCYSNKASFYVIINGKAEYIKDSELEGL